MFGWLYNMWWETPEKKTVEVTESNDKPTGTLIGVRSVVASFDNTEGPQTVQEVWGPLKKDETGTTTGCACKGFGEGVPGCCDGIKSE